MIIEYELGRLNPADGPSCPSNYEKEDKPAASLQVLTQNMHSSTAQE